MENNINDKAETFSFWKNLIIVFAFFTLTPLVLLTSLFSLFSLKRYSNTQKDIVAVNTSIYQSNSGLRVFASLPIDTPSISGYAISADARPELIRQYLAYYNSPLEPFSEKIVETADKYGLDYRLITAIAQQESNLCKIIPPQTFNCWGWGIHSKGTLGFSSFEEGIEIVSRGLKEEYIDKGFTNPDEIMTKYTPLSNGSWAFGVNKFMSEME
jgi:hypothetical protein